jgi:hypothetical protein
MNLILALIIFFCLLPSAGWSEEYKLDLSEIEKKTVTLGGYAEFRPILFGLDKDASLYKLRYYNQDFGNTQSEANFRLLLEGSYEKGMARISARAVTDLQNSYQGGSETTRLYEGFLSLKPSSSLTMEAGKKSLKWGKGYAWNPVAFLDRPKNPDDPELPLEGLVIASADYIKSFVGPLKTFAFTPVLVPVTDAVNEDFGSRNNLNLAGKLYFLYYDTDLDLIFLSGGSQTPRIGFDFSRNISTNFEIHGELAFIKDARKRWIDSQGGIFENRYDAWSYLLGLRYLTTKDTTFILEYYRNGTGFSSQEMKNYFSFINRGYDLYRSTGNDSQLRQAASLSEAGYGRLNPMQNYLYGRISQKEPFDILYFTPALTGIYNPDDRSFTLSPELLYTGWTNWEFRLKGGWLVGERASEFGERQNDYRIELRVRYYF